MTMSKMPNPKSRQCLKYPLILSEVSNTLVRVVIVSISPAENVSNADLVLDLKKRLESESFTVDKISIVDDKEIIIPA